MLKVTQLEMVPLPYPQGKLESTLPHFYTTLQFKRITLCPEKLQVGGWGWEVGIKGDNKEN